MATATIKAKVNGVMEEISFQPEEPQKEEHSLTIPTREVEGLCKLLKRTQKNIAGLEWNVGESYKKNYRHYISGSVETWTHDVTDVTVMLPTVNEWMLVATVVKGVLFVTNPRNELHLVNGHGAEYGKCDVCKHKATRKSFIVRNVKTNEELQVGSECARKFNINLVNAIYRLTNELYASYDLFAGEEDGMPVWGGRYSDPYAVRSIETSVIVQAAKKYYDDHNGVWKKGYYDEDNRYYTPSESAAGIKGMLDGYTPNAEEPYYKELVSYLKDTFEAGAYNDFEERIKEVGENFYMSAGDVAPVFFAIKRFEAYKRERANKEAGIYMPKCGDYIHLLGKIVNKTQKVGAFGDYFEYEILNTIDNILYKRSGAVKENADGMVDGYAFVGSTWNGNYSLERVTKNPKKGYQIANVF